MLRRNALLAGTSTMAINLGLAAVLLAAMPLGAQADSVVAAPMVGPVTWAGGNMTLTNTGTIDGGTNGIEVGSASVGTLSNSGLITGTANGIRNSYGTIARIDNTGTIGGGTAGLTNSNAVIGVVTNSGFISAIANVGTNLTTIGTITNSGSIGTISGQGDTRFGTLTNQAGGTIGSLSLGSRTLLVTNAGTIGGGATGFANLALLDRFDNSGTVAGTTYGVDNSTGSIGVAINHASGTISGGFVGYRVAQGAGTIINNGLITGGGSGMLLQPALGGSIASIANGGTILGGDAGIENRTVFSTLTNTGVIRGDTGFVTKSTIGTVSNSGIIRGDTVAFNNIGDHFTIGTVAALNNSGTIVGPTAIANSGVLGSITNSGVIDGDIGNSTAVPLTIAGGSGATYGTLRGGTIISTSGGVLFSAGNILLLDNVNVGTRTLSVTGANLRLDAAQTVTGNYSQSGGGLIIGVTDASRHGSLSVSGDATVANTAITIVGNSLANGQTLTIVRAGGTGSYTNDTVSVARAGMTASLVNSGNDLLVVLAGQPLTYSNLAGTFGGVLDRVTNASSPQAAAFQADVLGALNALPVSAQGTAIRQLQPMRVAPAQASFGAGNAVAGVVSQHQQTAMATDSAGTQGIAAGSEAHDSSLWGQFLGGGALRGSTANAAGYSTRHFGIATGVDTRPTNDTLAGVALSWLRAHTRGTDEAAGSSSTLDSVQLTLYGSWRLGPAFIDGQVGGGYNHFDQTRDIGFLARRASASYDGQLYRAKVAVGYDLPLDGAKLTPLAGLSWQRAVNDAYAETGAGTANLVIESQGATSVSHELGARIAWTVPTALGTLTPAVQAAWLHDYTHGPIATSGLMGGEAFATTTDRPAADGARIGVSATLDGDGDFSYRAEYEGEMRPHYQSHAGLLRVIWGF